MTQVLPEISVSVKAILVRDEKVLLLSYDVGGFHYNLPGGKARKGERLRETVRRKVLDETGLTVGTVTLVAVVEYVPEHWDGAFGDVQKVQLQFLAELTSHAEPRFSTPRDPDQVGFEWVPIDELTSVNLLPKISARLVSILAGELADQLIDEW